MTSVAVVILTLNEEKNISKALHSVVGWADEVFVLDSFSTDKTLELATEFDCNIVQNAFVNYSQQRNFAIEKLPIQSEWVFFLDADEWLPKALKDEISGTIRREPHESGFYAKRRFMWMGRWIRRGYYPTWILRLFRRADGRCEDRSVNEHIVVDGKIGYLAHDFIHEDQKGISDWIAKHNRYATLEAVELAKGATDDNSGELRASLFGAQSERKRWIRRHIWQRLPPLVRPFLFAFYRIVVRGGFLDGTTALGYHLLHAWFILLVDLKYLEIKRVERTARAK